jgi:uncharacterized protein
MPRNLLDGELEPCSTEPLTGFYRDGCCRTGASDSGVHVVCAEMTADFLAFSVERGNDLVTARPEWGFPGLQPGDRWCLCAERWVEALEADVAPRVVLRSTHASMLEYATMDDLLAHAVDGDAL